MNIDPNITKYLIKVKITADGVVEKPDVVGAIFGQTEGLLGDELDLRDLQKSGKIGRIEVEIESKNGKSEGIVFIPSGMDQVETSIIAASLETIDRIGPCKAKVEVLDVEDIRASKREKVIERAKEILEKMLENNKSVGENLVQTVKSLVENSEIVAFGEEKLPAGPNVANSESIIIVEGRNDVLNLLKYGIKNAIAVEGTNVPKTISELSKQRTTTAFLDGDRGGDLILKELLQVADIDFVARAPPGFEVEELTYKQVVKALRDKMPVDQYLITHGMQLELKNLNEKNAKQNEQVRAEETARISPIQHNEVKVEDPNNLQQKVENHARTEQSVQTNNSKEDNNHRQENHDAKKDQRKSNEFSVIKLIDEAAQLKEVRFYDDKWNLVGKLPLSDVVDKFDTVEKKYSKIVTGGIVSQRLLDTSYLNGVKEIYGVKMGHINKRPAEIKVFTKDFAK
jgi:DNA primase